jgi:hypothetical protein
VRFHHACCSALTEICGGKQVMGSTRQGTGGGGAGWGRKIGRGVNALSVLVAELQREQVRASGERMQGCGDWESDGHLQHIVVVLELSLGNLFNGKGRRNAHGRENLLFKAWNGDVAAATRREGYHLLQDLQVLQAVFGELGWHVDLQQRRHTQFATEHAQRKTDRVATFFKETLIK